MGQSKSIRLHGWDVTSLINAGLGKGLNWSSWGVWHVYGEDPNCDLGGPHSNPSLGTFEGTLQDAAEYALSLSGYMAWGGGGYIEKVEVAHGDCPVNANDPVRATAERVTALKKELAQAEISHENALRQSELRLTVLGKVEPLLKSMSKEQREVAVEVIIAYLKTLKS